jgi:hypothetical protein
MNVDIEIEVGIPLPEKLRRARGKYPFEMLEVGDSFRVEASIGTMRNRCSRRGAQLGRRFTCRVVNGGFVRVWRVS